MVGETRLSQHGPNSSLNINSRIIKYDVTIHNIHNLEVHLLYKSNEPGFARKNWQPRVRKWAWSYTIRDMKTVELLHYNCIQELCNPNKRNGISRIKVIIHIYIYIRICTLLSNIIMLSIRNAENPSKNWLSERWESSHYHLPFPQKHISLSFLQKPCNHDNILHAVMKIPHSWENHEHEWTVCRYGIITSFKTNIARFESFIYVLLMRKEYNERCAACCKRHNHHLIPSLNISMANT